LGDAAKNSKIGMGAFSNYGREEVKPERKRQLGMSRRRWEYNIKMDF
jgi:hypothetical protein